MRRNFDSAPVMILTPSLTLVIQIKTTLNESVNKKQVIFAGLKLFFKLELFRSKLFLLNKILTENSWSKMLAK